MRCNRLNFLAETVNDPAFNGMRRFKRDHYAIMIHFYIIYKNMNGFLLIFAHNRYIM